MIITPQISGVLQSAPRAAQKGDRHRLLPQRPSSSTSLPRSRRRVTAAAHRQRAASVSRDSGHLCASWTTERDAFELDVRIHAAGLQLTLQTWVNAGPTLEQSFVVHTRAEFEQWMQTAPTKFGHPVAHDEIQRFAHESLSR